MDNFAATITRTETYALDISIEELAELGRELNADMSGFPEDMDSEEFESDVVTWMNENPDVVSALIDRGDHVGLDEEDLNTEL